MSKVIIPDNEIWCNGGNKAKPDSNRFSKGNESGVTADPPKDEDHNYQMWRADANIQAILREGVTEWDIKEKYPQYGFCRVGWGLYFSMVADNVGNDPAKTLGTKWKEYAGYATATEKGTIRAKLDGNKLYLYTKD